MIFSLKFFLDLNIVFCLAMAILALESLYKIVINILTKVIKSKMVEEWVEATLTSSQDQSGIMEKTVEKLSGTNNWRIVGERLYNHGQTEETASPLHNWYRVWRRC